jgi:hypothetical protein
MSIFSFPRINVKGLISVNVGTANNDDYSGYQFPPGGPYAGLPLRLADTKSVQALTYGMTDDEWIQWVQQTHLFVPPPQKMAALTEPASIRIAKSEDGLAAGAAETAAQSSTGATRAADGALEPFIPGEWNFYGDMGLTMMQVKVLAVQFADRLATSEGDSDLINAELSFKNRSGPTGRSTGVLVDVNPEDSPCSQVFSDALTLEKNGQAIFTGKPTKTVTRWINFQCNTNLTGPNGAGGAMQCVVPLSELAGQPILGYMPATGPGGAKLAGIVFRYYLYRPLQPINTFKYVGQAWFDAITALYKKEGLNSDFLEICGTIAPWFEGEMESVTTGRLLNPVPGNTIAIPPGDQGNGRNFALAPAVLHVGTDLISVDFCGTFPDRYQGNFDPMQTGTNGKYDFGPVNLHLVTGGSFFRPVGNVNYQSTAAGDQRGWIFDFPLANLQPADIESGIFALVLTEPGILKPLLSEAADGYMIASDQAGLFGEQVVATGGPEPQASKFVSQNGVPEPATVRVFQKGRELTAAASPPITIWMYDTTPIQAPSPRQLLRTGYKPGDPLTVGVGQPGNRLFVFTLPGQPEPPVEYSNFNSTVFPIISLRILPNDRDYRQYYRDPNAPQPVGNDLLTYQVLFDEVLRNYYLLYPAMNQRVPLNDPEQWENPVMAGNMYKRTQSTWWDKAEYMPRTRDLSSSRRTLIHAWCRKYLAP